MLKQLADDAEERLKKCIDGLHRDLSKVRTGRASPGLLDGVMVPYYGNDTPLSQVANVAVSDSRTLAVTPWEKALVPAIEKAIRGADLGLNPINTGGIIRVPMPPLTEERRKDLIRLVRQEGESSRVSVRNVRRDANNQLKEALKAKEISEDDERQGQDVIQKLTDKYIAQIDKLLAAKETDLMEI